ncbi:MAG TPA: helix-turn-helix domain-containing protein, partial [Arenibaculum sp.]|nr:helix-turn-helix domain-containing protein [Arenibaculum sp.]
FPMPRRHGQAERLSAVMKWLDENLAAPTTLSEIAQRVGMTERTLLRHFKASTGQTPMDWLVQRRVARARSLIESSDLSIGEIAIETGFGSAEALRYHFSRLMSAPPSAYRRGGLRPDP